MNLVKMRIRNLLGHIKVKEILDRDFVKISPSMLVREALEYFQKIEFSFRALPVTQGDKIVGLINLSDIAKLPRVKHSKIAIKEVMQKISDQNSLSIENDAILAITKMLQNRSDLLPILDGDKIIGVVTKDTLLEFLNDGNVGLRNNRRKISKTLLS
jgi:CBS domain-containing protein